MNPAAKSFAIVVWHHRVLGITWALCALFPAVAAFHFLWSSQFFLLLLVSAIYVSTSIGFIQGHTWARRVMLALLLIAALWFFDMILMCGVGGNRLGVWVMFVALCFAAYTFLFLVVSALYCPKND